MKFFQRLGRSIMLPVAVLPVAAILSGISYWIQSAAGGANVVSTFLGAAGGALLDNMPLLFAIGVSIGMANKTDGTSALAGLVSWLTITTLLSPAKVQGLFGIADVADVNPAFGKIQNVFVGIIAGLIGAWCYNRFKDTKLPDFLSFFSGKRSVAIVTAGLSLVVAVVLLFVWPVIYTGLVTFGEWIATMGPFGAGLYGFFNRLLIPTGLHHALNSVFWFDVAGINDLTNFLNGTNGDGVYGVTGQYMAGFFPVMMFGLPGAALAMFLTAKTTRRKVTYGIMLSAAVASFFVGVTEPLEFSFMFVAPWLYLIHAVFMGISVGVAAFLPTRLGFGFSGGFIDMVLQWANPLAQNPWILLLMGVAWFFIYFFTFYFLIKRFNLKTPGREDELDTQDADNIETSLTGYHGTAEKFIAALGGKDNIIDVDNCATRLRMEIENPAVIDEHALKRAGAAGVIKPGGKSVQVVYGLNVQFVKDAMEDIINDRMPQIEAFGRATGVEPPLATQTVATAIASATVVLRQPVAGAVVPLSEVPDPMFAEGTMGPGIAVDPTGDTIVAPADGTVASVFPTGHAIGLALADGTELLIHVGIDTVSLKGDGFETLVAAGQQVTAGTPLLRFDAAKIRAAGLSPITPVIVLNNESATVSFQ
ncbi:N-acetylglucosamine-specific PTS transporter subunit IIBC [Microbacterium telephonicum]|uniref:PTS system N-acetylglucosamine-specific IIA component (Glc family) /PTS system N-acetylglucosamine-specific IIB component (Glc family) /PTS system N-acetylglucosamine-specific IIC component (Glc fa... n=1 Tax=Microbacterium telephonicum TaxID=1714841 RepID=A0A498C3H2_9MICO|nr:N-acetylglucosamine-specific PTS transporter subunit IIBC [Microbacterium telephonicum]RLK49527.1 PTS system N-acetylglucosamine-specific IIA component (Glc family) /PTS system N-acetylglucosamine-specific IIB component (Glc family) /PTS system N-acetylglucosamine-specific IIC component (Glc family) [Microbacterium telephonicum]